MVLGTSFHFDGQGTATAADAMKRYCGLLGEQEMEGKSPTRWLATKELVKDDGEMVFEDGVSRFGPKCAKILKSAVEGTNPRLFSVRRVLLTSHPRDQQLSDE
ncbi:hypothetical protein [Streptomyces sp. NPDC090798]|uniref:hypothetical protein n=1 Tax=Streptomyces sp. NPDC090798 TaxID=3365968 RepID=UPI0037F320EF